MGFLVVAVGGSAFSFRRTPVGGDVTETLLDRELLGLVLPRGRLLIPAQQVFGALCGLIAR